MALTPTRNKLKASTLSLIFLFLTVPLLLTLSFPPKPEVKFRGSIAENPQWYNVLAQEVQRRKIKVGLVNTDILELGEHGKVLQHGLADVVTIDFDRVDETLRWEDFFPEWIDEDRKWGQPSCPQIPMPRFENYRDIGVVVARVPCGGGGEGEGKGVRDVYRLQVNLLVANMLVRSRWTNDQGVVDRTVYSVFIGSCGPMWEIFRCDDLLWHEGDYWVYKPDLRRLSQKVMMPVGSCKLAPTKGELAGQKIWRSNTLSIQNATPSQKPREAYVTILHSTESYVCGAIALAQSIIQANSTRDLVLLADSSISAQSLRGLRSAGWKVKSIKRIRSPHATRHAYNEWNYSKLRLWELTEYDKIIFIDSDLIVVKNMDDFFIYPQLSASGNDQVLFNSGVMLIEPSKCTFSTLTQKRHEIASYNGGDQGFLNEMFTWWHRWPSRVNYLKIFEGEDNVDRDIPNDLYAIHYLGLKPWMCYRDYDCNWDMLDQRVYASDAAHQRWWKVYRDMPRRLQKYCGLSEGMDARIRKWRRKAKKANFPDVHWKIKVRDLRKWRHQS
ncbi:hypothetical protein Vadar_010102 [Vaccinium darrowii]|uniref:Uncharacterized protein n=1 Tax=Vaccinium darrowii TaxID=229202 RepID=A0ACB7XYE2_9ERIC|nr:hypothetical protein Vadar_010102 [Vaccinium darrowii]